MTTFFNFFSKRTKNRGLQLTSSNRNNPSRVLQILSGLPMSRLLEIVSNSCLVKGNDEATRRQRIGKFVIDKLADEEDIELSCAASDVLKKVF